ncbi:MAG: protein kinase [Candidatus Obscuribacterales bacterium]|nr:protein kinase [Candidatus Obscuribacterales bacterium]
MTTEERCPRCGGTTGKQVAGSITQWIAVCNCASTVLTELESAEPIKIQICSRCGKRIKQGRAGSLTQWVFRQDLCGCEVPEPIEADLDQQSALERSAELEQQKSFLNSVFTSPRQIGTAEQTIEIDFTKFPVERFTPIAELGKGGFGTVYCCRDKLLDKQVAVKCLNAAEPRQLIAFQNEARAASKLNHRNIVKILDLGATASGTPYIAMELINGISLDRRIEQGELLSTDETVDLFRDVCTALAHAHTSGVLHRDIKPSNLLISNHKPLTVSIIDFGVAVLQGKDQGKTISGTPEYMPPDQARGEEYDRRSEVYELGCTLFEALTGSRPFNGDTPLELLRQHAEQQPPMLVEMRPGVNFPEGLEEIVAKCLAKKKSARFQNMTEVAGALSDLMQRQPQIEEELPRKHVEAARKGGYLVTTAVLALAVVVSLELGLKVLQDSQKLTEGKVPAVPEHSIYGAVLVDAAYEIERPRFEQTTRHGKPWWISKGAVTNDSLIDLSRRSDIERLSLIGDTVDGRGLVFIQDLPLKGLDLASTQMRDKDIDALYKFENLEVLGLENTHVTDVGLEKLEPMTSLQDLKIGGPNISDESLKVVAKLKSLRLFEVKPAPKITGVGIEHLSALPRLRILTLNFAHVDKALLTAYTKCKSVEHIGLAESKFEDDAFTALEGFELNELSLHRDHITDEQLHQIASMKSLNQLDLTGSTGFSANGLREIQKRFPKIVFEMHPAKKKTHEFNDE